MDRTKLLKEALRPWMRVDTWNTTHPLDDKRFHRALKNALDQAGTGLTSSDFRPVMMELARESKPQWPVELGRGSGALRGSGREHRQLP